MNGYNFNKEYLRINIFVYYFVSQNSNNIENGLLRYYQVIHFNVRTIQ